MGMALISFRFLAALIGMCFAIMINEICCTLPDEEQCNSSTINFLKTLTSLSTAVTILFMLWQLSLIRRRDATKASLSTRHVKYKPKNDQSAKKETFAIRCIQTSLGLFFSSAIWKYWPHILNMALNCVHTVPGLSFLVNADMLGMFVEYRIESLLTVTDSRWSQPRPALTNRAEHRS